MSNQLRFDDRVVVVTGAGAGLGREYAHLFASRGAKVVVNDLGGNFHGEGKSNAADVVVAEIKANGGTAVADYNSVVEGQKIIQTALEAFGRVDVVVNNAGILRDKSFARISDADWDLIHDVHLKGAFKTTQAAWPVFRKQNFGRIIVTSSNSGVYGNFGQANYSAAKLGLIGLSNTLAIEGAKYNIHCNVIVPTAASRMTQGILPDFLFDELKPKLIAPVVAYLCHESNNDNGAVIESAAGWATKIQTVRGKGAVLRTSIDGEVTPEYVRDVWDKVTDMSQSAHTAAIGDASVQLMAVLENLRDSPLTNGNSNEVSDTFSFGSKDLILYNLGLGISVKDQSELKFLYENHPDFTAFPSFFILPGLLVSMTSNLVSSAITHTTVNLTNILHGEQYFEVFDDLPLDGELTTKGTVIDVMDKKSGAVVVTNCDTYNKSGKLLCRNQSSTFIVGAGNFGGKKDANSSVICTIPTPKSKPDVVVRIPTSVDQAALYRLSGDYNPMHIDPSFSQMAGHKIPILHGLCTLGISIRGVLKEMANNDPSKFKCVKARFVKPVIPGQTLEIQMWKAGSRIYFKTIVVETNNEVLSGAYLDLKETIVVNKTSGSSLNSDGIFQNIKDRVKEDPAKAKSVNAVFLFKITSNGSVAKEWTLDLKTPLVHEGAPTSGKIDTTLTLSDGDMVDMALGKLNGQAAFMKGKLKLSGNIMLTQKLMPLLKSEAKL